MTLPIPTTYLYEEYVSLTAADVGHRNEWYNTVPGHASSHGLRTILSTCLTSSATTVRPLSSSNVLMSMRAIPLAN